MEHGTNYVPAEYAAFKPSTLLSPVPAVLVTCAEAGGRPNAITLAWVGTVCSEPPMVSISVRPDRFSHGIIERSGEFVVNLVDTARCEILDYCGVKSGRDTDKFADCGLRARPMEGLQWAPAADGFPAHLGCRVRQVLHLGSHDMFIGEIVSVEVRADLMHADGSLHLEETELVSYAHGLYQRSRDVLGFFGYSVARPEVRARRMKEFETK